MFPVLFSILRWLLLALIAWVVLVPLFVFMLAMLFWSRQREMVVSEEAPEPVVKSRIRHQTAAT